jgi:flagellar biogenesis protein FliO
VAEVEPLSTWDMMVYGSRVLLALVVVIPLLYYGLRVIGRRVTVSRSIHGYIEIVDVLHLGGGNQLLLARVAARVLLLSVSKDRTSLLWEGPAEEFDFKARPMQDRLPPDLRQWVERWRKGQRGDGQGDDG